MHDFGTRLVVDPELAGKVNAWIGDAAGYLVQTYRADIAGVITDTVARWDAEETSQKIELQVGRDLQFIRINGTVVGALAGLAIFTVATASSARRARLRQASLAGQACPAGLSRGDRRARAWAQPAQKKRTRWPGRAWASSGRSAAATTAGTG